MSLTEDRSFLKQKHAFGVDEYKKCVQLRIVVVFFSHRVARRVRFFRPMPSLPTVFVMVLLMATLFVVGFAHACRMSAASTEAFRRAAPARLPDHCATVGRDPNLPSYSTCMQTRSHGWCADRRGDGQCMPGGLDGPFDPEGRCANWWYAGRCQWGPLCRRVDPIVPAARERTTPYHHPAPYYYRSCPSTSAWRVGKGCGGCP